MSRRFLPGQQGLNPAKLLEKPTDTWPVYHGDYSGRRYSTLSKINQGNINSLGLAWVYRANGALGGGGGFGGRISATPLQVNGVRAEAMAISPGHDRSFSPTPTQGRLPRAPGEITHPSVIMLSLTIAPSWIVTGGRSSDCVCTTQVRSFRSNGGGCFRRSMWVCQYASTVPTSTQYPWNG